MENTILTFLSFLTLHESSPLLVTHFIQLLKKTLKDVSTSLSLHLSNITHPNSSINLLSSYFKNNGHNQNKKKEDIPPPIPQAASLISQLHDRLP